MLTFDDDIELMSCVQLIIVFKKQITSVCHRHMSLEQPS
jgi:hypothetical protein